MTLSKLVVSNISRRRGRFAFTLLGITIGIASFVTFQSMGGSLKKEIYRETNALGANLVVVPKGSCGYEQLSVLTGDQMPTTITMAEIGKISAIKGLTVVPFLAQKTAINNKPVSVSGILPEETKRLKGWKVSQGSYFGPGSADGVVVGTALADQFGLRPGSSLTVRGTQLAVAGVLARTGGRDDYTLFIPLSTAQRLFKAVDRVSYAAVTVDNLALIDQYIEQITVESGGLGVISDKQMLRSVLAIVGSVNITLQLIAAVSVLAAAFGIINTMMTATYERKREIGILLALGARQSTIFGAFILESGFYGLLGGVCGVAAGLVTSMAVAPYIGNNAFTTLVKGSGTASVIDLKLVVGSIVFSTIVAVVAGLYPAWRAARLSPVEAISYE
ncbi:ABC transporter permease [Trichlorobacter ammonificans]|uniref:ABC transport system permease protein n=1 Tax=Trichlorobacter ammonificans TaxID=2916410 RepID=A0ABM9D8Q3_9BACT|nr:ABC transporter permease [Trichlorobacter ammonificans]CAH2031599.1 Putative ABC transport system permease protein [Trichlorobacter ammonificans]